MYEEYRELTTSPISHRLSLSSASQVGDTGSLLKNIEDLSFNHDEGPSKERSLSVLSLYSNSSQSIMPKPKPVVVSGPSGGGKSTILKKLFENYPNCFAFSVSHTTRKPRPGEEDGKDYYFVERECMEKAIENGEFLEHAEFGGNLYGTSKKTVEDIQETGRICFLDVELQGVRNIKKTDLAPTYIFVKPPTFELLEQRLRGRQTENEDSLMKRLDRAKTDMAIVESEPELFDSVVINDDLDTAYTDFVAVIKDELDKVDLNETAQ